MAERDPKLQWVNVRGVIATVKQAIPLMKARGGSIVINGSINAHIGMPNSSVYTASKAALISLAKTLSFELSADKIRINTLIPGRIATDRLRQGPPFPPPALRWALI